MASIKCPRCGHTAIDTVDQDGAPIWACLAQGHRMPRTEERKESMAELTNVERAAPPIEKPWQPPQPALPSRQEQAAAEAAHADWDVIARARLDLLLAMIGPILDMQAEAERIHAALTAAGGTELPELSWAKGKRR